MFLGMEQVSSLSRLLNLHRLLQQKESNQLKKENKMKKSFCISECMFLCVVGDDDNIHLPYFKFFIKKKKKKKKIAFSLTAIRL